MSRLNLPRYMKPNDLAAQFDIQFTGFDGKLDDIGVFALVRQSFAAMRLIVILSHQLDAILDNPVRLMVQPQGMTSGPLDLRTASAVPERR